MKNKKLLYVLLPITLLIWGNLFYKIFSSINGGDVVNNNLNNFTQTEVTSTLPDTFSIDPSYRDPFLGQSARKIERVYSKNTSSESGNTKSQSRPSQTGSQWPEIIYTGMIKNQKSSKQLVMVQINGQSVIMAKGDKAGGVELLKVGKDFIEVRLGTESKIVNRV